MVIPKASPGLPYDVTFYFEGITNGTYQAPKYLPPGMSWEIVITSLPFNWTTAVQDPSALRYCTVSDWVPDAAPIDWNPYQVPHYPHDPERRIDCWWSCPIMG